MDANVLNAEQQALLASIMGSSPQPGSFSFTTKVQSPVAAAAPAAPVASDPGKMLSQAEIDALIASMGN
ncbi:hypothetical protein [Butyrivibrio sp. YAB3001]|uniref:hypothetical protein n=1 Tax=Butyrivibrio sp. YAB3001 TaxID=1520812 RepID=UPI0008F6839C|nr:hypothetical protein [Butyrivibrio sp. YAB3001]SFB82129.1 hypothetical protein SAMN02910398_00744 [Butyrivibrio sp. YAB3001]